MRFGVLLLLSFCSTTVWAEPTNIAVLPIRANAPPTADPTLLRLTEEIGRAIHDAAQSAVRVVSRELRDETCPSNQGSCPNDVASLLRADRVVSLWLDDAHEKLFFRMYGSLRGLEKEIALPCQRDGTRVRCDTKRITAKLMQAEPSKLDATKVNQAFGALATRLEACLAEKSKRSGKAEAANSGPVEVQFQIDDRGRATNVRIEPRRVERQPRYRCMARIVEQLSLAGDGRDLGPFRFPLPAPGTSSP